MKTIIAGVLSALALTATVSVASAQSFPPCFQGDTMDRDASHTGRLGAPKCDDQYVGRSVAQDNRSASPNDAYGEYDGGVNR
jgi:hypothetical protein